MLSHYTKGLLLVLFIYYQSATLLLNASVNDQDVMVKKAAHSTYQLHPKAGKLTFTDQNILIRYEYHIY